MANTTNFNWETPDDTDLVKDGAAAIRTLGNSIDTSFVDLKGGTTGQILSKASNTDLDYTWIANDQGDITEVQAGTGISVASGTGPIPVVTNTVATAYDAKGDLVVGTGADTFSRLAVGTNGYTLVADSAEATGLKWAAAASGGETLISTTTLTGSSVLLDNIPSTYNDLKLIIRDYLPASDNYSLRMRYNDDANANRHRTGTDLAFGGAFNDTSVNISAGNDNSVSESLIWVFIPDYTNTTTWQLNDSLSIVTDATTTANFQIWRQWGVYNQTGAISSLRLFPESGNFTSGTALLYGVK
jgi:hypothetical protein